MRFLIPIVLVIIHTLTGCALLPFDDDFDAQQADSAGLDPEAYYSQFAQRHEEETAALMAAQQLEAERIRAAVRYSDLVVGMGMDQVRAVWGEPREVQTAGDARMGNQRWVYFNGLSSPWSLSSARIVYFEEGRVVGWDTR